MMTTERRAKTLDSFIFTGVLITEKQKRFDKHVTGIRGSNSARNRISRKTKDEDNDSFLTDLTISLEDTLIPIEDSNQLSPREEDTLDTKYEKLDIRDIQKKLYKRECEKLGVIPIGTYMRNPCNSELHLKYYSMGSDGAKALAIPLMLDSSLVRLDLEGNDIQARGMAGIAEMLIESVTVKELNVSKNNLGHQGAKIFKNLLLKNRFIETVYLAENSFSDIDASTFADVLKNNKTLKKLILSHNSFGDESGVIFGNALAFNETLDHLDLSWNKLRGKSAEQLCFSLRENVGLRYLNLAFNGCGIDGAKAVGKVLGSNSTLQELDLTDNRLNVGDIKDIINQLSGNETLNILRLGDNLITNIGSLQILRVFIKTENSVLQLLDLKNTNVNKEFLEELKEFSSSRESPPVILHGSCPSVCG